MSEILTSFTQTEIVDLAIGSIKKRAKELEISDQEYIKLTYLMGIYFKDPPKSTLSALKQLYTGKRISTEPENTILKRKIDNLSGLKRPDLTSDILDWSYVAAISDGSKYGISNYTLYYLDLCYYSTKKIPDDIKNRVRSFVSITSEVAILQRRSWKSVPFINLPSFGLKKK